jgi:murein DD-endopeptidase MepM/ murein hydrolase activator NlpD
VRNRTPRNILVSFTAAALALLGGETAGLAQAVGPPATTTTVTVAPTTTVPPTTVPPTTVTPTTAPETKLIPVPQNTILDRDTPGAATSSTKPGDPAPSTTVPPVSLSAGQADAFVRDQARTAASSTAKLIEALKPLQNLGMTVQEALALGMGRFPVLGLANWNDDWLDYRAGPPVHAHQGTDVFSAFDTPVRSPVDGTVRFEDAGLGGKGAFVTAPDGTYYYMAHLNSFNADLGNGSAVKQGQVIGYNGDSGNAKGGAPHVHFEVHPGGGAAVNPKPFLDTWLQQATDQVPALLASFQPKPAEGTSAVAADEGLPQILMTTGLTRRFSAPSLPAPHRGRPAEDFNRAVLGPLTPPALAALLDPAQSDK